MVLSESGQLSVMFNFKSFHWRGMLSFKRGKLCRKVSFKIGKLRIKLAFESDLLWCYPWFKQGLCFQRSLKFIGLIFQVHWQRVLIILWYILVRNRHDFGELFLVKESRRRFLRVEVAESFVNREVNRLNRLDHTAWVLLLCCAEADNTACSLEVFSHQVFLIFYKGGVVIILTREICESTVIVGIVQPLSRKQVAGLEENTLERIIPDRVIFAF